MKRTAYPTISIITPSYNQGQFIKETIDSVLAQGYPKLEYWVIDGGSSDNTLEILKSYGKKINWISEKDRGQTHAINKGLEKISGEIVAYLNSDDVYTPHTLMAVADYFKAHPEAQWLTGDYFIIDEHGENIQSFVAWYKKILRTFSSKHVLLVANYINQPATFWRRSIVSEIGSFDETIKFCMDYEYWLRIIRKYPLHVLDQRLALFRIHRDSKGGAKFAAQFQEEHAIVKKYSTNPLVRFLHWVHAQAIVAVYTIVKKY